METKDFNKRSKELKKALRKHVKAIKGEKEKKEALEVLDEFIENVWDASFLKVTNRRRLFKMIVIVWDYMLNGEDLFSNEDCVTDEDYDMAKDVSDNLYMEVLNGKL